MKNKVKKMKKMKKKLQTKNAEHGDSNGERLRVPHARA
jgi:hypothetical protein